jgi:hypothetical protein
MLSLAWTGSDRWFLVTCMNRWSLKEFSYEKRDILELTMCCWRIGDRTKKLEATRQGSRVRLVFYLCRLRTDRCSSLLSCWTHASHLASWIKYLSTAKLVTWFRPGPTWVRVLVLKGVWQGREEWAQGASWQSAAPVYPTTFTGILSFVICSSLDRWVWFVWGINHQLVRNRFESPSLLDSEHLTRATAS